MSTAFAVSIGNTRTQIGRLLDGRIEEWASVSSETPKHALERLTDWSRDVAKEDLVVLLASVRTDTAKAMRSLIVDQLGAEIIELEKDHVFLDGHVEGLEAELPPDTHAVVEHYKSQRARLSNSGTER